MATLTENRRTAEARVRAVERASRAMAEALLADRYPDGAEFVSIGHPDFDELVAEVVREHRPLVVVEADGAETLYA